MPLLQTATIAIWDLALVIVNALTPNRAVEVDKKKWPEYVPPKEGDSRCSCPALNALANHGILPHDGKNIPFKEMSRVINETYNFAPTFCFFVPDFAARFLGRVYSKDTFDLAELDKHNEIEHDASLTRQDIHFNPDQSKPHLPFVEELLASATGSDKAGEKLLTEEDLARYSAKRRVDSKRGNPEYTMEKKHETFGSSNNSTMIRIFGGRVSDLRVMLVEERIPEGWVSACRARKGLTIMSFNKTVFAVEKKTKGFLKEAEEEAGKAALEESSGSE